VTCVHVGVLPPTHNWAKKICKIVRPKRGLALFIHMSGENLYFEQGQYYTAES
jgi:hypothetical protein